MYAFNWAKRIVDEWVKFGSRSEQYLFYLYKWYQRVQFGPQNTLTPFLYGECFNKDYPQIIDRLARFLQFLDESPDNRRAWSTIKNRAKRIKEELPPNDDEIMVARYIFRSWAQRMLF